MRVLLVEDSPTVREVLRGSLAGLGYEIAEACNGSQALTLLHEGTFDIVFTDLVMPEMDGYELCEEIRRHPSHRDMPIIVLSSHQEAPYVMQALRRGADDFLVKPADPQTIASVVARVLAHV